MDRANHPSAATETEQWTTHALLRWMHNRFQSQGLESPRLVAEMLLSHVLQCERLRLYMEVDRPASPEEREQLRHLIRRVSHHEPVQYVLGHAHFYGRCFAVDRCTLIPRPSSETIVEHALLWMREQKSPAPRIADIGTGTGCIGISLLCEGPGGATVLATDIDDAILDLARRNATKHEVSDRFRVAKGSLFDPFDPPVREGSGLFDVIVANPPYIPDDEWKDVAANVRDHEPARALRGGADGLDVVRPLIRAAGERLRPEGLLLVEIAASQDKQAMEVAQETGHFTAIDILPDHEDLPRVLHALRTPDVWAGRSPEDAGL